VLTVVEILWRKGWLAREKDGRAYRYQATVSREDYTVSALGDIQWVCARATAMNASADW